MIRGFFAAMVGLLLLAVPVTAAPLSATISPSVGAGTVTYTVTISGVRADDSVWIGQNCYLDGANVDLAYGGTYLALTPLRGHKFSGVGAVTLATSGIHHGSAGDTTWTSDHCQAWVWLWPDLTPIATTPLFPV